MTLRTALCDVLGIEYPILQSGMGNVAGPELVAEVSKAGGLGIIAALNLPLEELQRRIRWVREHTDRPFGVNLWLHSELRPPIDPAKIPMATVARVQDTLNEFRGRLDIPKKSGPPAAMPDLIDRVIALLLEERVPVFSTGIGLPDAATIRRCHDAGVKVAAMIATVEDARTVDAAGADVIIAQGAEAGGHRSVGVKPTVPEAASVGTLAFVPQVVDAVRAPVVAAGGIADGRGLIAALALGAGGALLGTRFVATRESLAAEFWKKRLLESDGGGTTMTDAFTGQWARTLANTFSREYRAAGAPVLPSLLQTATARDIYDASAARQDGEYFPMYAGQAVGLIHNLPGAAEVVEQIVREARAVLADLGKRVR